MIKSLFKYSLTLLLLLLFTAKGYSQNKEDKSSIIQQRIEFISEQQDNENLDFSTLIDRLEFYYDHPINLNDASEEELKELQLLTLFQIQNLLSHTRLNGHFLTIYELRTVEGMDMLTIKNILPFVQVSTPAKRKKFTVKRALRYGKNDLFIRYSRVLEQKEGYQPIDAELLKQNPNKRYLGDPNKYYLRYRYQFANKISFGVTAEKDAGEEFFKGTNKQGFDFYSAHAFVRLNNTVQKIAIGDFQAQFGQGLTMWSGLSFGKSPDAINIMRFARGIQPYTSVNENRFLRGGAITLARNNWTLTSFFSSKNVDANSQKVDSTETVFTSFLNTGLHRTPAEFEDKQAINEIIGGSNITYSKESFKIGGTAVYSKYQGTINRDLTFYNQFELNDNENLNLGLDASYVSRHFMLFGEVSASKNYARAYLGGIQIQPVSRVNLVIYQRAFEKEFQNLLGNAVSESTRNQNEKGTYFGSHIKVSKTLDFRGYLDLFRFDWLRYQTNAPTSGSDYSLQLDWHVNRNTNIYFRYRNELKKRNDPQETSVIKKLVDQDKNSFRIHLSHTPTSKLTLKSRIEFSRYKLGDQKTETGFLAYQDVGYKGKWGSFSGRIALFDVTDYNARIYAYEQDVLYSFSIPAYYNKGLRLILLSKINLTKNLTLWGRVSRTYFSNVNKIGTGLEEISEPQKTEIRFQLRFRF